MTVGFVMASCANKPPVTDSAPVDTKRVATIRNVMSPIDNNGSKLHAHGGGIIKARDRWYWFGEMPRYQHWFYEGVSCYSSADLENWRFEGNVLPASGEGNLSHKKVAYRPKVLYNDRTKKYVMILTECNGDFTDGHLSFATADSVAGPYKYAGWCYGAGGRHVMDMTAYKDDDGQAYVSYSANTDRTGHWVDKLSDDYLTVVSNVSHPSTFDREAPCIFKTGGRYFLYFSECTGWEPNQGHYVTSTSLSGPWTQETNFGDATTFKSQGGCIFEVSGTSGTTFIYVGDQWNAVHEPGLNFGDPTDLRRSNYIWLPINVNGSTMSINYLPTWSLDLAAGTWSASSPSNTQPPAAGQVSH